MQNVFRKSIVPPLAAFVAATVVSAAALADDAVKIGYIKMT